MNNIPVGYIQTEVGVIPKDWEVKKLGDFSLIRSGESPSKFKMDKIGIPYYKVEQLNNGNKYTAETPYQIQISDPVKKGSIVFPKRGASIMLNKIRIFSTDSYLDTNLMALTLDNSIESEFVFYALSYFGLDKIADTTSIPQINNKHINPFLLSLPPTKAEQTAIATALSDADALISSLEKLIAKKRLIKQGAMQELLNVRTTDLFDLNDDADLKKNGSGNKVTSKWEVRKLGEIAEIVGGGTPSTHVSQYWNGTINWFTPTEIGIHKYTYESQRKITKEGLSNCSARILPIGTILLTSRAGIGDLSILMKEGCTNQGFQSLIAKEGHSNEYLYYLMQTLKNVLLQNASGSTFLEISPNKIKQIEVSIPCHEEQIRIASILSDIDSEIATLETKLGKARKIKLGMMQELLTGKIRLV